MSNWNILAKNIQEKIFWQEFSMFAFYRKSEISSFQLAVSIFVIPSNKMVQAEKHA
jgi:hypothetical protein